MLKKMKRLPLCILFLTAVVCLTTADTHTGYNQMESRLKKFVDLAIIKANQDFNFGHLNFFEFGKYTNGHEIKEVSPWVRMDVRLMNTHCKKVNDASGHRHRPDCPFKKLQVWCIVCSSDPDTKPYIGCVRRLFAQKLQSMYDQHCPVVTLPGEGTILFTRTEGEAEQPGCLGCF